MADLPIPRPERTVIFGDGTAAIIFDIREVVIDDRLFLEFEFRPTEATIFIHKGMFTADKIDNRMNQTFVRRFPEEKCIQISRSPFFTTWLVTLLPNLSDPGLLRRIIGDAQNKIEMLISENIALRKQIAHVEIDRMSIIEHREEFDMKVIEKIKKEVNAVIPGESVKNDEVAGFDTR